MTTALADRIDAALPQTQCTRCGFPDCRGYADAVAAGSTDINHCPPGGSAGIATLAVLTGRPALPLDPVNGIEGPRLLAVIDEGWCIGCTLCLDACPVDCIVGAPKLMHTVIDGLCTGCELCVPVCPVDCIAMAPHPDPGWTAAQARAARERHAFHRDRRERDARESQARLAAAAAEVARSRTRP